MIVFGHIGTEVMVIASEEWAAEHAVFQPRLIYFFADLTPVEM